MTEFDSSLALESQSVTRRWVGGFRVERTTVGVGDWLMLCAAASWTASQAEPLLSVVYALTAMLALSGSRRPALTPAALPEVPSLCVRLGIAGLVVAPLAVVVGAPALFVLQALFSIVSVLIGRTVVYAAIRASRRRRVISVPTSVIGSGPATVRAMELLAEHPESGLEVIAVEPGFEALDSGSHALVIVELDSDATRELGPIVNQVGCRGGEVFMASDLLGVLPLSRRDRLEDVAGLALVRVAPPATCRAGWRAKRAFDIVVAALGLVLLSPVFLAAAIGTRLSSPGPILFRQSRVGRNGRLFTMYKFRTFPVDHVDDKFSRDHGECPLPFGRFLRRTSIDEFPQLFNVLRGEMSIVGPRPERPHFVAPLAKTVSGYSLRHRVPGGITGAAQVGGYWGNSCIDSRIALDNNYIDEWSFWHDVAILARTPVAIIQKSRL